MLTAETVMNDLIGTPVVFMLDGDKDVKFEGTFTKLDNLLEFTDYMTVVSNGREYDIAYAGYEQHIFGYGLSTVLIHNVDNGEEKQVFGFGAEVINEEYKIFYIPSETIVELEKVEVVTTTFRLK